MAGAGYKTFVTGDVLTASQVQTYLQDQTVMVFADATARSTALSAVLAQGMVSFLKSDNTVYVYNGSAWVSVAGTISPLTTKGDLYTYSTTNARLAVGNNGDLLTPDSSVSTGLRWQGFYSAGKNKIINGDFFINQRNFTSNTTAGTFNFDRWIQWNSGGTCTLTPQTFTPGNAISGYESKYYLQAITASQSAAGDYGLIATRIEDVRTFANQTVTISFWAKAGSGTPKIGVGYTQNFGTGGSSQVQGGISAVTLSTSWARYSVTTTLPSISGKTIGSDNGYLEVDLWISAGSTFATYASSIGIQNATFQIWGVQLEAGSVATSFTTATGTQQGELAACQRYYWRGNPTQGVSVLSTGGMGTTSTTANIGFGLPVPLRIQPTAIDYSSLALWDSTSAVINITAAALNNTGNGVVCVSFTVASGVTANRPYFVVSTATSGYIGFSAEL